MTFTSRSQKTCRFSARIASTISICLIGVSGVTSNSARSPRRKHHMPSAPAGEVFCKVVLRWYGLVLQFFFQASFHFHCVVCGGWSYRLLPVCLSVCQFFFYLSRSIKIWLPSRPRCNNDRVYACCVAKDCSERFKFVEMAPNAPQL